MSNFKNNIDKLVSRILNEEIESKVKQLSKNIKEGEWTEIEVDEQLKGKQKKIDVAEPKGKITAADFKKLRDAKSHKEEVEEWFFYPEKDDDEDEEYDEDTLDKIYGEIDRVNNPMSRPDNDRPKFPKMIGSFDDEHGFYDQDDRQYTGDFDFDYDEEEFDDFDSFDSKYGGKQRMFGKGDQGRKFFDIYKDKFGGKPFRVRTPRDMGEAETEEGNAFTGALADAKKDGKDSFEVDGKKFNVKESNRRLSNQMNLASVLKSVKEDVKSLKLTENELIDMIENIVKEQQVKDKSEENNIGKKEPQALKDTNKVLGKNKQENDSYAKEVVEKMKDYMKDMYMGDGGYDENPDDFPQSNYDMEKDHKEKKYNPSDAVEEYIEAFAYPGMTNLVYDEIKPDDEMIEKQIKGDSKNGNAVTDEDNNALGNVSKRSTKVGDRFKKNFDDNLYGAEQQNVSYKRQSQPVDVAGDKKQSGGLKKNSTAKAEKIMNQLESTEDKKLKIIAEEMSKMKNLIGYDRKTQ
jgi:ElaB/YqjD/DUF883 family membrane-anchored ribosome-binding protein